MAGAYPARIMGLAHEYQRMRGIGSGWRGTGRGSWRRRFEVKRCLSMFASYDISS